ncbi:MAG: DsbA family protein [Alphaproteobacteria bacterium]
MSEKKSPLLPLIAGVVLLAIAGYFVYQQNQGRISTGETKTRTITETADIADQSNATRATVQDEDNAVRQDTTQPVEPTQSTAGSAVSIDVEEALSERAMGDPNAPVVMREFASLTCGHCGTFHKETFDQIKEQYIDTGKVYFIFTDFPLNGPALHAGMIARCLPEGRYFNFLNMLFKSQEDWAYEPTYLTYLRQNAALAGLGNDAFDACISNEELREGLTNAMRRAQQGYSVSSTPTFVFNEDNVVTGARDFAFFKNIIEEELSGAE